MRGFCICLVVTALGSTLASGQVVSEWRSARGVPVAVVEVTGGDVEHIAAVLPADAAAPAAVAGFTVEVRPRRSGQIWSTTVPSVACQPVLAEIIGALSHSGSAALVVLGPVPAREVQNLGAAIDAMAAAPPTHAACTVAEGAVAERPGPRDSVELALALPRLDDPRTDLAPALVSWIRIRLASSFPDLRVADEVQDGCPRLVIRAPVQGEHPRLTLRRIRQALTQLPTVPATGDELARAIAACEERAGQAVVDGASVARDLAERLALGGSAVRAFAAPSIDATTMAELARQVLSGHPGSATLFEHESRPEGEPGRTLENGVVVSTRWIPGETGVVAIALGGVAPRAGREILAAAAATAARQGWPAVVGEIAGVPTLAIAAPAASVPDLIERVSESLSSARPAVRDDLEAEVARTLGLAESLTAEAVSVALALPPEVEVGNEAVDKFFGGFTSGRVTTGVVPAAPGLRWTVDEGTPQILGLAELPQSAAGLAALQVVYERLGQDSGVRVTALAPPGRLLLAVGAEGGHDVPSLDARLAALWKTVLRPVSGVEAAMAARRALAALYGDTAQATARAAAAAFLPTVPAPAELLGMDVAELNKAIAALPVWDKLTRFARGAPPPPPAQPGRKAGVRKSVSPQRRER